MLLAAAMACGGDDEAAAPPPAPPAASSGAEDPPALRDPSLTSSAAEQGGSSLSRPPADPASMQDGTVADIPVPALPIAAKDASDGLRAAWSSADAALTLEPPPLPEDTGADRYGQWIQNEWVQWFERKWKRVQAAIDDCDHVVAEGGREAPVAAALAGIMAAQTLQQVLGVPIPDALASRREIADAVRERLLPRAEPILQVAQGSFGQCENLAGDALGKWRDFCKDHRRITVDEWRRAVGDDDVAAR